MVEVLCVVPDETGGRVGGGGGGGVAVRSLTEGGGADQALVSREAGGEGGHGGGHRLVTGARAGVRSVTETVCRVGRDW